MKRIIRILLATACLLAPGSAWAQGTTAFTYQGTLTDNGGPANGGYLMQFTLYDAPVDGNIIGTTHHSGPLTVANGVFTLALDFGGAAFDGGPRWLSIQVAHADTPSSFETLSPRQRLTAVPYALFAMTPAGPKGDKGDAGPTGPVGPQGPQGAPGAASTDANTLLLGSDADMNEDDSTVSLGTDGVARLTLGQNGSVVIGDTLSSSAALGATVSGGAVNVASGVHSTIGGGLGHTASGTHATVAGGNNNFATMQEATVGGGFQNMATGMNSTIGGGAGNVAAGTGATVPGGLGNQATGDFSFAGGKDAQAGHQGAVVFSDSQGAPFASTANDQFLIRAAGGVGIGKNDPATALDVNGIVRATGFESSGAPLNLAAGAGQALTLSADDGVGIGTTNPITALQIDAAPVSHKGQFVIVDPLHNSSQNEAFVALSGWGNDIAGTATGRLWYLGSSSVGNQQVGLLNTLDDRLSFGTADTFDMHLYQEKLGIGTSDPLEKLHVVGPQAMANATRVLIESTGAEEAALRIKNSHRQWTLEVLGAGNFPGAFNLEDINAQASRIFINTAGQVGIGTVLPESKLDVSGSITADAMTSVGSLGGFVFRKHNDSSTHWAWAAGSSGAFLRRFGADVNLGAFGLGTPLNVRESGVVQIGTTSSLERGKLMVEGTGTFPITGAHGYLTSNPNPTGYISDTSTQRSDHSIWASDSIAAGSFRAFSDRRIKTIIGVSDGARDLAVLNRIEVTDYRHKDHVRKGSDVHKKVIAQQVETVFPVAVRQGPGVVPDIYRRAAHRGGWIELSTDLKTGDRVKLIGESNQAVHEVLEVRPGGFRTSFSDAGNEVFVFGREVDDFRTVDYEAIAMLNVSATQELHRRLRQKSEQLASLETRLARLEALLRRSEAGGAE